MKNVLAVFLLYSLCLLWPAVAAAGIVEGIVRDGASRAPVAWATVRLLRPDSSLVAGQATAERGTFAFGGVAPGRYVVQVSFVGYATQARAVSLAADTSRVRLAPVDLPPVGHVLAEARVVARLPEVEADGDTLAFNASAYRVPEGSALEELIERLPGVEVGDDGTITVGGKRVTRFLVNGKDFFKGDPQVAMKNLPADMVRKVKTYDKQSDYTEQTGIDDGEEETVMDVQLKRELNESWVSRINAGYATHGLYEGRAFVNRLRDYSRLSFVGNVRNPNGTGRNEDAGFDFNVANYKDSRERRRAGSYGVSGSVRVARGRSDRTTGGNSETYLTAGSTGAFSNRWNRSRSRAVDWNARLRAEWHPDTLTSLSVEPSFAHRTSASGSLGRSAQFNADPYALPGTGNPLDAAFADPPGADLAAILVNRQLRQRSSEGRTVSGGLNVVASRRLSCRGRSLDVSASASLNRTAGRAFNRSDIRYFQPGADVPLRLTDQFDDTPSERWAYRVQAGWNEPLFDGASLQLRYSYARSHNRSDRSLYRLDSLDAWSAAHALGDLPDGEVLQTLLDVRNSRYTTTDDATHTANFGFRWVSRTVRLNVGVDVRRRTTDMAYRRDRLDTVVARRWTHALPSARFRYRFSRHEQLELRYRTSVSAPGLASLLDVTDDSDPQRISTGNPSLRPSWTHRLTAGYNRYDPERQRGWNANLRFNRTARSISTAVAYDETTGVRTTRPENINGNWDAGAGLTVHSALGRERRFRLQSESHADYRNSVGFIRTQGQQASQKNTNRTLGLRQRLKGTYRNDWLEVELNARLNYRHSRNELNPATGYDTYHYDFGARIQVRLPWRMTVETDASLQSRRGYDDRTMNTDELVWNARIAQNFLPKNAATLSLRLHDILRQRTGVSQRISASGRSDSWREQVYSYVMLQFTYRLNVFKRERPRP